MFTPNMSFLMKKNSTEGVHLEPTILFPSELLDTNALLDQGYLPISLHNVTFDTDTPRTGQHIVKVWLLCTALRKLALDDYCNISNFLFPLQIKIDKGVTIDGLKAAIIGFVFGSSANLVTFLSSAVFSKTDPDYQSLEHYLDAAYLRVDWSQLVEPSSEEIRDCWMMDRCGKSIIRVEYRKCTGDYAALGHELRKEFAKKVHRLSLPAGHNEASLTHPPSLNNTVSSNTADEDDESSASRPQSDAPPSPEGPIQKCYPVIPEVRSQPSTQQTGIPNHLMTHDEAVEVLSELCYKNGITYTNSYVISSFITTIAFHLNGELLIYRDFFNQHPIKLATEVNDYLISMINNTGLVSRKPVGEEILQFKDISDELKKIQVFPKSISERLTFIETSTKNILAYLKSGESRIQPATLPTVLPVTKPLREETSTPAVQHNDEPKIYKKLPKLDLG